MNLPQLASAPSGVAATRGRREQVRLLAPCLLHAPPADILCGAGCLIGEIAQGKTGLGRPIVRAADVEPADASRVTVAQTSAVPADTLETVRRLFLTRSRGTQH